MQGGRQTRFWKDEWMEECCFKVAFPSLFKKCHDQDISVEEAGKKGLGSGL